MIQLSDLLYSAYSIYFHTLFKMDKQTKRSQLSQLFQERQLALDERLHSLRLQVDTIEHNAQDSRKVLQLCDLYDQWKKVRGNSLLRTQCKMMIQSDRREEIQRFEHRVLQQRHTLSRKEQEIWQLSWNGKRIRYLALHTEHMAQYANEIKQTNILMKELAQKSTLLKEVDSLKTKLKVFPKAEQINDFKRIETPFIQQMCEEQQRQKGLVQLEKSLTAELAQLSQKHQQLAQRYQALCCQKERLISDREQKDGGDRSAKSISTNSEEQIEVD